MRQLLLFHKQARRKQIRRAVVYHSISLSVDFFAAIGTEHRSGRELCTTSGTEHRSLLFHGSSADCAECCSSKRCAALYAKSAGLNLSRLCGCCFGYRLSGCFFDWSGCFLNWSGYFFDRSRSFFNRSGSFLNRSGSCLDRSECCLDRSECCLDRSGCCLDRCGCFLGCRICVYFLYSGLCGSFIL